MSRTAPDTRPTEAECQRTIVEAARLGGWMVHAERPAMRQSGTWSTPIQGDAGFPDLVMVRGTRVLAVELKRRPRKIDGAQLLWLRAFTRAGVDARLVYVPEQLDDLVAELVAR